MRLFPSAHECDFSQGTLYSNVTFSPFYVLVLKQSLVALGILFCSLCNKRVLGRGCKHIPKVKPDAGAW